MAPRYLVVHMKANREVEGTFLKKSPQYHARRTLGRILINTGAVLRKTDGYTCTKMLVSLGPMIPLTEPTRYIPMVSRSTARYAPVEPTGRTMLSKRELQSADLQVKIQNSKQEELDPTTQNQIHEKKNTTSKKAPDGSFTSLQSGQIRHLAVSPGTDLQDTPPQGQHAVDYSSPKSWAYRQNGAQ